MPLSICVILRIYNEDAIYVSFLLLVECATFFLSRSSSSLPAFAPHRVSLTLFVSLALGQQHADTFVIVTTASISQSMDELMSHDGNYCYTTHDDVRSFAKRVTTATVLSYVTMNLHLAHDEIQAIQKMRIHVLFQCLL